MGFLSPGAGYAWAGRRLEGDLFLGWVPEALAGEDLFALTAKGTWLPWRLPLGRRASLQPLTASLQVTYTFGRDYFVRPPGRFPGGYYDFPTALRAGAAAGLSLGLRTGAGRISLYAELGAVDVMLFAWLRNRRSLGLADVVGLAVGLRLEL